VRKRHDSGGAARLRVARNIPAAGLREIAELQAGGATSDEDDALVRIQMKRLSQCDKRSATGRMLWCLLSLLTTDAKLNLAVNMTLIPWVGADSDLSDCDDGQAMHCLPVRPMTGRSPHKQARTQSERSRLTFQLQQPQFNIYSQLLPPTTERERRNGVGAHLRC
jgi:hypothetical protein